MSHPAKLAAPTLPPHLGDATLQPADGLLRCRDARPAPVADDQLGPTIGRIGVGGALVAMILLAVQGLVAISVADATSEVPEAVRIERLYGIVSMLNGITLIIAGIAVLRARAWSGWARFFPLAGIYVFVPLTIGYLRPDPRQGGHRRLDASLRGPGFALISPATSRPMAGRTCRHPASVREVREYVPGRADISGRSAAGRPRSDPAEKNRPGVGRTAAMVEQVRAPGDETYQKFDFYFSRECGGDPGHRGGIRDLRLFGRAAAK